MKDLEVTKANHMLNDGDLVIIDVRELYEIEAVSLHNFIHIPMNKIPNSLEQIPRNIAVGIICHHGVRSARVVQFLIQNGFDNIVNIKGGIDQWSKKADSSIPIYTKSFGRAFVTD